MRGASWIATTRKEQI